MILSSFASWADFGIFFGCLIIGAFLIRIARNGEKNEHL